jgi:hypothetical protein
MLGVLLWRSQELRASLDVRGRELAHALTSSKAEKRFQDKEAQRLVGAGR